jgi:hypothetical protein
MRFCCRCLRSISIQYEEKEQVGINHCWSQSDDCSRPDLDNPRSKAFVCQKLLPIEIHEIDANVIVFGIALAVTS